MISSVLTVSQVNFFIKSLIEGDGRLNDLYISGEISNFTDHYRSGHLYFSLKDEKSVLKAVMFAGSAKRLKFKPTDGMKVIIRGRVSVYEPSGQYQLYAEDIQPDGVGAMSIAFEQLKRKLEAEGLFSDEYKKPLPAYPVKIGVITSSTGAAVRDIMQITARRWPVAEIVMCPVLVQGDGAPAQLTEAMRELNRLRACDVIIIGRGGGSIEDLQAFNDETLARAIFQSVIPVISAVGHETDYTIADFVADQRAPTPSAAAELATPNIKEEAAQVLRFYDYFQDGAAKYIEYLRQSVDILYADSLLGMRQGITDRLRRDTDDTVRSLRSAFTLTYERGKGEFARLAGKLDSLSPLKTLKRGFAVVTGEEGVIRKSVRDFKTGESIHIQLSDGRVQAEVKNTQEGDQIR